MNIFGWKSTGRGLLRPAKARVRQDRLSGVRAYGAERREDHGKRVQSGAEHPLFGSGRESCCRCRRRIRLYIWNKWNRWGYSAESLNGLEQG